MNKKDTIIKVAKTLFLENGYRGTTIRHIAKEAGVNVAMISYYFGSKELLLQELIETRIKTFSYQLDKLSKDKSIAPEEKLEKAVSLYIQRIFTNLKVSAIFHREVSMIEKNSLRKRMIKNFIGTAENMKSIIKEGQEKKIFKKNIDIELMVLTIISTTVQFTQAQFYTKSILKLDIMKLNEKERKALIERLNKHLMLLIENNLKK